MLSLHAEIFQSEKTESVFQRINWSVGGDVIPADIFAYITWSGVG